MDANVVTDTAADKGGGGGADGSTGASNETDGGKSD
jgi:hypothetical protein